MADAIRRPKMPEDRRGGRKFAPLPPGIVRVRLEGESRGDLAARMAAVPGVSVVTGPDEHPGGRMYLIVALAEADASGGDPVG